MIKCVIIDDAKATIDTLAEYIGKVNFLQLVGTSTSSVIGIELVKKHQAHLLFLDVDMSRISVLDVMWILQSRVKVIFCTAYSASELAVEIHELNAVDYLMKPILFDLFLKAVRKVKHNEGYNQLPVLQQDYFFVRVSHKGKKIRVEVKSIEFVEARKNYIAIYLNKDKLPVIAYGTLCDLEKHLPAVNFIRVHKSFIISVAGVYAIEKNTIKLLYHSQALIPLGRSYKDAFLQAINSKIIFPQR